MKTAPVLPGREPDVLFVANEHLNRFRKNYLEGPADLVVEIISPEGRNMDYHQKFQEYQEGGVREFWLIDLILGVCRFYVLGEDGKYAESPVDDGVYHSIVIPDCWIRVDWLMQDPLPNTLDVIREWGALSV